MIFIYRTFPNKRITEKVVDKLLKEKLVGCANLYNIESRFWWEGKIEKGKEVSVILKVLEKDKEKVKKRLEELHPYSVPCICEIKVKANRKFEEWLRKIKL